MEGVPNRLTYLNTVHPAGSAVWGALAGVVLLKEVWVHKGIMGTAFEVSKC